MYGLIGEHLEHSYSKELHALLAPYSYELIELAPDELEAFFRARHFRGLNVTIPYKQAVIPFLDELSPAAEAIGAVNAVVNRGGRLCGHNTDFDGLRALARHAGVDMAGQKVLILGTGGAAQATRAAAESLGAAEIVFVSRSGKPGAVSYEEAACVHADAGVIVNATPVGMYPNEGRSPIDLAPFHALRGVLDAVYHPLRTELVLDARDRGIPAEGGLWMLCAQAARAAALFQGEETARPVPPLYTALCRQKENVVLIGMPTAGKTTVGRLLARQMGRSFYDTDELICKRIGTSIADYMANEGEAAFRALEREEVRAVSRESGCVIAVGGGAVLDGDNVRALKQNGRLVFLDRPLEQLTASPDRPLSSDPRRLERMFYERRAIYQRAADCTVTCAGTPQEVAQAVSKEWQK